MLKTSVVICTYNGELYLEDQLNSLIIQRRVPDEIIIVDDCSDDTSWHLISRFKECHVNVNIRIFRNEKNIGFVKNFSLAAQLAVHDLIFFCDQDDVWAPDKIDRAVKRFSEDSSLTCLHTNAFIVGDDLRDLGKDLFTVLRVSRHELKLMTSGRYFEVLLKRNVVTGATMVVRRELLPELLPVPAGWIHDEWISLVSCLKGKVSYDSHRLIKYRIHPNNAVGLEVNRRKFGFFISRKSVRDSYSLKISKLLELHRENIAVGFERDYLTAFILHLQFRIFVSSLSYHKRIIPIFKKINDGSYSRFSRGFFSAIRDFFSL